jgi:hypothetical protein
MSLSGSETKGSYGFWSSSPSSLLLWHGPELEGICHPICRFEPSLRKWQHSIPFHPSGIQARRVEEMSLSFQSFSGFNMSNTTITKNSYHRSILMGTNKHGELRKRSSHIQLGHFQVRR